MTAAQAFGTTPMAPDEERAFWAHVAAYNASYEPVDRDDLAEIPDPRDDPAFEPDDRSFDDQVIAYRGAELDNDPRPRPLNVADLTAPPAIDDFLIDGFLRPNVLAMLAGAAAAGKSQARKELEIVASTGCAPLVGRYSVPEPMAVLTFDEDNGDAEEYRRDEVYLGHYGLTRADLSGCYRLSWPALRLETEDSQDWLARTVDDVYARANRPRLLLILDPVSHMYAAKELREDLLPVYQFLRRMLADRPWLTILLVHHLRKLAQGASWERSLDDVRGGPWGAWVDVVAILAPMGERRARWSLHKRIAPSSLILEQTEAGPFVLVADAAERKPSSDDRVIAAIDAGATAVDELVEALGLAERTIWKAVGRLRKAGILAPGTPLRRPESEQ